jgi:hypothetical protein
MLEFLWDAAGLVILVVFAAVAIALYSTRNLD